MSEEIEDVFSGEIISQPLDAETFAKKNLKIYERSIWI